MTDVVGGVYAETCVEPEWDQLYGSAGRAAHALSGVSGDIHLHTYIDDANRDQLSALAASFRAGLTAERIERTLAFRYFHPLSTPAIWPPVHVLRPESPLTVSGEAILRFGMLEGDAVVSGERVVYDPQSAYAPRPFSENGSRAQHLAIVANANEVRKMSGHQDIITAARSVLHRDHAAVVVVKRGGRGAVVVTATREVEIPAYRGQAVFSIGSGDVFAAAFTHFWAELGLDPANAADLSSRATARYCETRDAVLVQRDVLEHEWNTTVRFRNGCAYLAGPFFNIAQRWLVEEARAQLFDMGLDVFSPLHEVGRGPGEIVATKDIEGLARCDRMLALVDDGDPGTLFEIGYARATSTPVVALAKTLSEEHLKMLVGTHCETTNDFSTALYFTAWCC